MKFGRGQQRERRGDGALGAVLTGCVLVALLIGALELLAIVQIAQAGPSVGDIVAFRAEGAGIDEGPITVAYTVGDSRTCVLSPRVMRATGGSLVVEGQDLKPERLYRVHWAGTRTTDGADDCGGQADLSIPVVDLRALASATGQLAPDGRIATRF